jgi:hypothetical protein
MPRAPAARGAGVPISDGVPGMMPDSQPSHAPTSAVGGRGAVPPGRPSRDGHPGLGETGARPPTSPVEQALAGMTAGPIDAGYDAPTSPSLPPAPPSQPPMPLTSPHTPPGMPAAPHTPGHPSRDGHPGLSETGAGLPAHLAPYAMQQPYPGAPGAPGGYPFQPYPGGQPQSFTKQMQALVELDEIPSHYKLGSPGKSWLLRALLALVLVAGGVGVALLIVKSSEEEAIQASLLIDSTPAGATVTVDGTVLLDKTPARFETVPGRRHEILVELTGHKPHSDAVVVPDGGGQVRVFAFLPAITVKLRVVTVPPGADVYFGDALKGRTPLDLSDLDPASAREIEVRMKDYPPEKRTIVWEGKTEQTVEIRLKK